MTCIWDLGHGAPAGETVHAVHAALVVTLGVFNANARYLVPVGGMVIGNAMTAAAVSLNRVGDEVAQGRSARSRRRLRSG